MFLGSLALPVAATLAHGWTGARAAVLDGAHQVQAGQWLHGLASAAVVLIPVTWLLAGLGWARFLVRRDTRGLRTPARTERSAWAHAERQLRAAARLTRSSIPLVTGWLTPQIVLGRSAGTTSAAPTSGALRQLLARHSSMLTLPWLALREHMVVVGNPGSGKTTTLLRLVISFWATAWTQHRQWWRLGSVGRPLAIVADLKGVSAALESAEELRTAMVALGVPKERFGIFPHEVKLNLWGLEAQPMRTVMLAMANEGVTESSDPAEKYFASMREGLLHLVVDAPNPNKGIPAEQDPPRNSIEFLSRLDQDVLETRWAGHKAELSDIIAMLGGKQAMLRTERLSWANIFRALGDAFDGDAALTDFDVLYLCLDATTSPAIAGTQFGALMQMAAQLAASDHNRTIEWFTDEFAQVAKNTSGATRMVTLFRSFGIGSVWLSQSWYGLGATDDARHELVNACSGGALIMRGEQLDTLCEKFGTKRRFELSRKLINGTRHGDEGNVQAQDTWLVDPNRVRRFERGDVVHATKGRAAWGHITPLNPAQLSPLPGLAESTTPIPADHRGGHRRKERGMNPHDDNEEIVLARYENELSDDTELATLAASVYRIPDGGRTAVVLKPKLKQAAKARDSIRVWAPGITATTVVVGALVFVVPPTFPLIAYGLVWIGFGWWHAAGRPSTTTTLATLAHLAGVAGRAVAVAVCFVATLTWRCIRRASAACAVSASSSSE